MSTVSALPDRIEGATFPPSVFTISVDGTTITDGADYTWQCEGSATTTAATKLWTKSTNLTAAAGGFTATWTSTDMGALTSGTSPASASYVLEFTGTASGGRVIKFQRTQKILPQVS